MPAAPAASPASTAPAPPLAAVAFTAAETARILAHGPWPAPVGRDPGNRVDGRADAVALGRRLFADPRLSAGGRLACATCHDPAQGFQDGRRFSRHGRNTPGLLDAAQRRWFGWDGAKDSLWAASLAPLTAADELAATPASLRALLDGDRALAAAFRRVFGAPRDDAALPVDAAKALAAYLATLRSPRTAFDDFRDALQRGDAAAAARYPAAAQRGLQLFVGRGRCFFCHAGAAFTNDEFADIGRPFFTDAGADPGRWGGLRQLRASAYTRLGAFDDAGVATGVGAHVGGGVGTDMGTATGTGLGDRIGVEVGGNAGGNPRAVATRHVVAEPRHFGEFRVPSLRGLPVTAPYFHDGSAATLDDAVRHYATIDPDRLHADGPQLLQALALTASEQADLVAFLRSLGAPPRRRPPRPPGGGAG